MEFSPNNNVVMLCLQGMGMEVKNKPEQASKLFLQAWNEATDDLERFISAYHIGRHHSDVSTKLRWFETALQFALKMDNDMAKSAFPFLHSKIAKCYEDLGDVEGAAKHYELARSFEARPSDKGPFYHGTKADLQIGDLLIAGGRSNYKPDVSMNHIYFTAVVDGAGLAAGLAKGDGRQRVYIVEPTGDFENDPNVTNKKFPGNPTRSYRSHQPLRIVGELKDWVRQTPEELQTWREKLAKNKGEIIN